RLILLSLAVLGWWLLSLGVRRLTTLLLAALRWGLTLGWLSGITRWRLGCRSLVCWLLSLVWRRWFRSRRRRLRSGWRSRRWWLRSGSLGVVVCWRRWRWRWRWWGWLRFWWGGCGWWGCRRGVRWGVLRW